MYDYILLGIFEKHKLMYSFQLTIMIQEQKGAINRHEFDFFLKGNTSIEALKEKSIDWIPDAQFKDLHLLVTLGKRWNNLIPSI